MYGDVIFPTGNRCEYHPAGTVCRDGITGLVVVTDDISVIERRPVGENGEHGIKGAAIGVDGDPPGGRRGPFPPHRSPADGIEVIFVGLKGGSRVAAGSSGD